MDAVYSSSLSSIASLIHISGCTQKIPKCSSDPLYYSYNLSWPIKHDISNKYEKWWLDQIRS